jgi:DNA-directed RNA polymerase specialized sigma24 family protein/ribosome-associated translation inhibitor RaiA
VKRSDARPNRKLTSAIFHSPWKGANGTPLAKETDGAETAASETRRLDSMNTTWTYHNCGETLKGEIQSYAQKKIARIEKLLSRFRPSLKELVMTIYHHRQATGDHFEIRAVLHLPTCTLATQEVCGTWRGAIDGVLDELAHQVRRHKERLWGDWVYKRKRRQREELSAAGPLLTKDREQSRRKAFYQLLAPMLRTVENHARRELRLMELEGRIPAGEFSVVDVVDEVLLQAWRQYDERPRHLELDVWLMRILHQVLEQLGREPLKASLEEPVPWEEPPKDEEEIGYEEAELQTLADLVTDEQQASAWERIETDEQRRIVEQVLSRLEPRQRATLMAHVLDGFDIAEIAMIQDRDEKEVLADLQSAREALRQGIVGQIEQPANRW